MKNKLVIVRLKFPWDDYFSFSESEYVVDINGGSFTSSVPADFSIHLSAGNMMNIN